MYEHKYILLVYVNVSKVNAAVTLILKEHSPSESNMTIINYWYSNFGINMTMQCDLHKTGNRYKIIMIN